MNCWAVLLRCNYDCLPGSVLRDIHDCALEVGDGNVMRDDVSSCPGALGQIYGEAKAVAVCRKSLCKELIRSKTRMRPRNFRVLKVEQLYA